MLQRIDPILGLQYLIAFAQQETAGDLAHGEGVIHHHDGGQMFDWGRRCADLHRFLRSGCQRASFLLPAGECHRVEDEDDPAVAKDGGARDTDDPGELVADVLDDDFLVAA